MKLNKKAQNITKPYTIVFILVVISIFSIGMITFGRDVASNPNNSLDDESLLYVYEKTGFVPSGYKNDSDDADDLFYSSDLETSGNLKDYALEFQFYREQSSSIRTIVQDLWNVPSHFIGGLGLDLKEWEFTLQVLNTMVWLLIFYVIYRLVRGLL